MDKDVEKVYGNKVRVRACGLCWKDDLLLMVNHKGVTEGNFWCPPGGGVDFGQSIPDTLIKEFREETGLHIIPGAFLFGCEYIQKPIHSIELFYTVTIEGGNLKTGHDPEIQIIDAVTFMHFDAIKKIHEKEVHGIFNFTHNADALRNLSGFYRI